MRQSFALICSATWLAIAPCAGLRAADAPTTRSTDPAPTLISLHASNDSIASIVGKVAEQAGMPLIASPGTQNPTLSLDLDRQPFWNVIDQLCTKTNSSITPIFNGKPQLMLQPGGQSGQRIISGPVLMNFQSVEHTNRLTAPPDRKESCEVRGMVLWEPRLDVLFTDAWSAPSVAEDENGVSLVSAALNASAGPDNFYGQESMYGPFEVQQRFNQGARFQRELRVRLNVPATAGRKIKNLSGQWRLFVPGKIDHFDIPDIAAVAKKPGSFTFGELGSMKMSNANVNVQAIQMQFNMSGGMAAANAPSVETARRNCLLQSLHASVLDADGKLWGETTHDGNGGQVSLGSGGDLTYISVYVRPSPGVSSKPVKVTIEGPVTATEIDAAYSLHDLPLP